MPSKFSAQVDGALVVLAGVAAQVDQHAGVLVELGQPFGDALFEPDAALVGIEDGLVGGTL